MKKPLLSLVVIALLTVSAHPATAYSPSTNAQQQLRDRFELKIPQNNKKKRHKKGKGHNKQRQDQGYNN